ncbi:MAG: M20/M25/M40 family metallo-hydrolase [Acidobacteria bacterium]|nr:M20/M25/M40 family metallo-hydrolase [Acidobacteriota bacterium]
MQLFRLTRDLIEIESITGNEKNVALYLRDYLAAMGADVTLQDAEPDRPNVFAQWGKPDVVLTTHLDTVPPFIASREDDQFIYGRGACDAKGIIAAQIEAASRLQSEGISDYGLLFVVGEERNSAGAIAANSSPVGSRYLIDGEPTENKLALGTKGVLRVIVEATGRMAHSAYPELGDSAIEKLIDALGRIRKLELPEDPVLGKTTCNIGTIEGGVAPNVIPGSARAELMYRTVVPGEELVSVLRQAVGGLAQVNMTFYLPPIQLGTIDGLDTTVVSFATDIPSLTAWGRPYLIGPGSIHVAHTDNERVPKGELVQAAEIYASMVKKLKKEKLS